VREPPESSTDPSCSHFSLLVSADRTLYCCANTGHALLRP